MLSTSGETCGLIRCWPVSHAADCPRCLETPCPQCLEVRHNTCHHQRKRPVAWGFSGARAIWAMSRRASRCAAADLPRPRHRAHRGRRVPRRCRRALRPGRHPDRHSTAWCSPPGSPAARAAATRCRTNCTASASPRRTASPTTHRLRGKSSCRAELACAGAATRSKRSADRLPWCCGPGVGQAHPAGPSTPSDLRAFDFTA